MRGTLTVGLSGNVFTVTNSWSITLTTSDAWIKIVLLDAPSILDGPSNVTVGLGIFWSMSWGLTGGSVEDAKRNSQPAEVIEAK